MPINERLFPSAQLRQGHKLLHADRAFVQVAWKEDAARFDLRSADVVATVVAEVDVPANGCPMAVGQVWQMEAHDEGHKTPLEVLSVRLIQVQPGTSKFRRRYTWQFLIVRKPARDPYKLFPWPARPATVGAIPESGDDILGDLKQLLASEIADPAIARFNAEGGFRMQEA